MSQTAPELFGQPIVFNVPEPVNFVYKPDATTTKHSISTTLLFTSYLLLHGLYPQPLSDYSIHTLNKTPQVQATVHINNGSIPLILFTLIDKNSLQKHLAELNQRIDGFELVVEFESKLYRLFRYFLSESTTTTKPFTIFNATLNAVYHIKTLTHYAPMASSVPGVSMTQLGVPILVLPPLELNNTTTATANTSGHNPGAVLTDLNQSSPSHDSSDPSLGISLRCIELVMVNDPTISFENSTLKSQQHQSTILSNQPTTPWLTDSEPFCSGLYPNLFPLYIPSASQTSLYTPSHLQSELQITLPWFLGTAVNPIQVNLYPIGVISPNYNFHSKRFNPHPNLDRAILTTSLLDTEIPMGSSLLLNHTVPIPNFTIQKTENLMVLTPHQVRARLFFGFFFQFFLFPQEMTSLPPDAILLDCKMSYTQTPLKSDEIRTDKHVLPVPTSNSGQPGVGQQHQADFIFSIIPQMTLSFAPYDIISAFRARIIDNSEVLANDEINELRVATEKVQKYSHAVDRRIDWGIDLYLVFDHHLFKLHRLRDSKGVRVCNPITHAWEPHFPNVVQLGAVMSHIARIHEWQFQQQQALHPIQVQAQKLRAKDATKNIHLDPNYSGDEVYYSIQLPYVMTQGDCEEERVFRLGGQNAVHALLAGTALSTSNTTPQLTTMGDDNMINGNTNNPHTTLALCSTALGHRDDWTLSPNRFPQKGGFRTPYTSLQYQSLTGIQDTYFLSPSYVYLYPASLLFPQSIIQAVDGPWDVHEELAPRRGRHSADQDAQIGDKGDELDPKSDLNHHEMTLTPAIPIGSPLLGGTTPALGPLKRGRKSDKEKIAILQAQWGALLDTQHYLLSLNPPQPLSTTQLQQMKQIETQLHGFGVNPDGASVGGSNGGNASSSSSSTTSGPGRTRKGKNTQLSMSSSSSSSSTSLSTSLSSSLSHHHALTNPDGTLIAPLDHLPNGIAAAIVAGLLSPTLADATNYMNSASYMPLIDLAAPMSPLSGSTTTIPFSNGTTSAIIPGLVNGNNGTGSLSPALQAIQAFSGSLLALPSLPLKPTEADARKAVLIDEMASIGSAGANGVHPATIDENSDHFKQKVDEKMAVLMKDFNERLFQYDSSQDKLKQFKKQQVEMSSLQSKGFLWDNSSNFHQIGPDAITTTTTTTTVYSTITSPYHTLIPIAPGDRNAVTTTTLTSSLSNGHLNQGSSSSENLMLIGGSDSLHHTGSAPLSNPQTGTTTTTPTTGPGSGKGRKAGSGRSKETKDDNGGVATSTGKRPGRPSLHNNNNNTQHNNDDNTEMGDNEGGSSTTITASKRRGQSPAFHNETVAASQTPASGAKSRRLQAQQNAIDDAATGNFSLNQYQSSSSSTTSSTVNYNPGFGTGNSTTTTSLAHNNNNITTTIGHQLNPQNHHQQYPQHHVDGFDPNIPMVSQRQYDALVTKAAKLQSFNECKVELQQVLKTELSAEIKKDLKEKLFADLRRHRQHLDVVEQQRLDELRYQQLKFLHVTQRSQEHKLDKLYTVIKAQNNLLAMSIQEGRAENDIQYELLARHNTILSEKSSFYQQQLAKFGLAPLGYDDNQHHRQQDMESHNQFHGHNGFQINPHTTQPPTKRTAATLMNDCDDGTDDFRLRVEVDNNGQHGHQSDTRGLHNNNQPFPDNQHRYLDPSSAHHKRPKPNTSTTSISYPSPNALNDPLLATVCSSTEQLRRFKEDQLTILAQLPPNMIRLKHIQQVVADNQSTLLQYGRYNPPKQYSVDVIDAELMSKLRRVDGTTGGDQQSSSSGGGGGVRNQQYHEPNWVQIGQQRGSSSGANVVMGAAETNTKTSNTGGCNTNFNNNNNNIITDNTLNNNNIINNQPTTTPTQQQQHHQHQSQQQQFDKRTLEQLELLEQNEYLQSLKLTQRQGAINQRLLHEYCWNDITAGVSNINLTPNFLQSTDGLTQTPAASLIPGKKSTRKKGGR